ncbi:MAG: hypothetical protein NWF03_00815 [Candidatus Bathyarchaeota archaeon]|nr:hypothetical protein [Candidatus Bathyarchaeota archaeon]
MEEKIVEAPIKMDENEVPEEEIIDATISGNKLFVKEQVLEAVTKFPLGATKDERFHNYNSINPKLLEQVQQRKKLNKAKFFRKVGRFEQAAQLYEKIGMYEEAGKARAEQRQFSVRRSEISVDLNLLLDQIKDVGMVVVYQCPYCKAPMRITKETTLTELQKCSHCNTTYQPVDIADILKTVL